MERTEILKLMAALKLYGMRAAYDEVMTAGIKRQCAFGLSVPSHNT